MKQTILSILTVILTLCATSWLLTACKDTNTKQENVVPAYEGTYLDEDNNEPNLHINYRTTDGKYDVQIGIYRLTYLDDGIGTTGDEGLAFTATDAAGNPIAGIITLHGDTATVTFTDTSWELIEPGAQFHYVRHRF